jgi:hypothetical protein
VARALQIIFVGIFIGMIFIDRAQITAITLQMSI